MFRPKNLKIMPAENAPIEYESDTPVNEEIKPLEPITVKSVQENIANNIITSEPVDEFNGNKIENLEATGFKTIELLKVAGKTIDRPKFNIPLLQSIPLASVFQSFNAEQIADNKFRFMNFEFAIDVNKNRWFNITERKGNINALSLSKQLIAIAEDLNEIDNDKSLFLASCKHLNNLQLDLQKKDIISEEPVKTPSSQKELTAIEKNEIVADNSSNNAPVENNVQDTPAKAPYKEIDWRQLTDQLNTIPLASVMEMLGATANADGHRGKWKVHQTGNNIQVTNNMWKNWNTGEGGHGAITLLTEYISIVEQINLNDPEGKKHARKLAIKELMKEFGSDFDSSMLDAGSPVYKVPFSMPHIIDFKVNDVRTYLHEKRGLPLWVINKQINTGNLFAGFPSDWKQNPHLKNPDKLQNEHVWAVFLATNGNAAEMRAIDRHDQYAKILASGSEKSMGGFLIKAEKSCSEKTVTALEAAIDTMSYHAFYPGRVAISCMGVNFALAITSALEAIDAGYKFQLGFDNDLAGNMAAISFKDHLIEEIGEDEYKTLREKEKINFFDLGVKVLKETIKNDEIFYFDVTNNEKGKEAAMMFREQLLKEIPKQDLVQWEKHGKIKYINVCPAFEIMRDPKLEAQQVYDLLQSGKSYYLRSIVDPEERPEIKEKRLQFENTILALGGNTVEEWKATGKIIFEKIALAKDWNEFFLYQKENSPEFETKLREQEQEYIGYSVKEEPKAKKKKTI